MTKTSQINHSDFLLLNIWDGPKYSKQMHQFCLSYEEVKEIENILHKNALKLNIPMSTVARECSVSLIQSFHRYLSDETMSKETLTHSAKNAACLYVLGNIKPNILEQPNAKSVLQFHYEAEGFGTTYEQIPIFSFE